MNKRGGFAGGFFICLGCVLIALALGLTAYNFWDDRRAEQSVSGIMEAIDARLQNNYTAPPQSSTPGVSLTPGDDGSSTPETDEGEELPDYVKNPDKAMPAVEIDGIRYVGTVDIPTIALRLPITETWDNKKMKKAPCRYSGSAYLGNMVICGHNYKSHFGRLKNLKVGDKLTFTDMDGNVFSYEVAETEVLAPTAVEEMKGGGWALTLFTCTASGKTRLAIRCRAVGGFSE